MGWLLYALNCEAEKMTLVFPGDGISIFVRKVVCYCFMDEAGKNLFLEHVGR